MSIQNTYMFLLFLFIILCVAWKDGLMFQCFHKGPEIITANEKKLLGVQQDCVDGTNSFASSCGTNQGYDLCWQG